jgi:hypothetical protein
MNQPKFSTTWTSSPNIFRQAETNTLPSTTLRLRPRHPRPNPPPNNPSPPDPLRPQNTHSPPRPCPNPPHNLLPDGHLQKRHRPPAPRPNQPVQTSPFNPSQHTSDNRRLHRKGQHPSPPRRLALLPKRPQQLRFRGPRLAEPLPSRADALLAAAGVTLDGPGVSRAAGWRGFDRD